MCQVVNRRQFTGHKLILRVSNFQQASACSQRCLWNWLDSFHEAIAAIASRKIGENTTSYVGCNPIHRVMIMFFVIAETKTTRPTNGIAQPSAARTLTVQPVPDDGSLGADVQRRQQAWSGVEHGRARSFTAAPPHDVGMQIFDASGEVGCAFCLPGSWTHVCNHIIT